MGVARTTVGPQLYAATHNTHAHTTFAHNAFNQVYGAHRSSFAILLDRVYDIKVYPLILYTLPGFYYYYPVTSIGKHTHYAVLDYDTRHTRASTALSAAVTLMSRTDCISITQPGVYLMSI